MLSDVMLSDVSFADANTIYTIARHRGAMCRTCGEVAVVHSIAVNPRNLGYYIRYLCHGEFQDVDVGNLIDLDESMRRIPESVFLRSVATYGTVSPEARRERRYRLRGS